MTHEEAIRRIKDHMRVHRIGEYPHMMLAEALNMAIEAVEKQIHKKPLSFGNEAYLCPCCKRNNFYCGTKDLHKMNYCDYCGQKLDWSEQYEI